MASGSNLRGLVLLLITSGFFITGLLFDYMPIIVDDHIKRTIELATNEEIISYWSRPPVDLNSYYWLYEVTNPEQFSNGAKIQVRKVGPFHFISRMEKRVVEVSANKYRIIYNSTRYMRLNESFASSAAQLDERLTLLNPVYGSIIEGARVHVASMEEAQQRAIVLGTIRKLLSVHNESLLHNVSAREALVGRTMPIVQKLRKLALTFGVDAAQLPMAGSSDGRVGYVSLLNGSWSGPYEVYTGYQETAKSIGELISYRGKRRLNYYEGKCNRLQASVGELRPMPLDPRQPLEMFSPNFCRIIHLRPTGVHKMREGQAISYVLRAEDLQSADLNPDNRCYCTNSSASDNHCSLNGVLELAPCSLNAPLLLSVSNVELDQRITSTIGDYDPGLFSSEMEQMLPSDDQIQILILKRIGIPIHADLTITLLLKVVRDPAFSHTANVPPVTYVPLVTIREIVSVPPQLAQIIVNLESFLALTYHIKVVMYLSAVVLLCWLTGHYYSRTQQQNDRVGPASSRRRPSELSVAAANDDNKRNGGLAATSTIAANIGQSLDGYGSGCSLSGSGQNATELGRPSGSKQASEPNRRSSSQVAAAVAAATAEIASSERANSADSSRSLPPSRQASRVGSLDGPNASSASNERARPPTGQKQQEAGEGQIERAPEVASEPLPARAMLTLEQTQGEQPGARRSGARIFSKVDEQRALKGRNEEQTATGGETQAAANEHQQPAHKKRKIWLLNVSSYFVRMLNGLRTTISEASKLNISENDYQDKQLEMLAGKIDNWYVEAPATSLQEANEERSPEVVADANDTPGEVPQSGGAEGATETTAQSGASNSAASNNRVAAQKAVAAAAAADCPEPSNENGDKRAQQKAPSYRQSGAAGGVGPTRAANARATGPAEQAKRNGSLQSIEEEQLQLEQQRRAGKSLAGSKQQPQLQVARQASGAATNGKQGEHAEQEEIESEEAEDDETQEAVSEDSAAEAASKANTLEQIERALDEDTHSGQPQASERALVSSSDADEEDDAQERARHSGVRDKRQAKQQQRQPIMINSSTSIDSVINLADGGAPPPALSMQLGSGAQLASNGQQQPAKETNQSDHSSTSTTQTTASEIDHADETSTPSEQRADGLAPAQSRPPRQSAKDEGPPARGSGAAAALTSERSETIGGSRDQIRGAELEAPTKPLESHGGGLTLSPPRQQQKLQIMAKRQQANSAINEESGLSTSSAAAKAELRQAPEARGQGQPINTPTFRPKLFASEGPQQQQQQLNDNNGNNILHEKLVSELASGAADIGGGTRLLANGLGASSTPNGRQGGQSAALRRFEQVA